MINIEKAAVAGTAAGKAANEITAFQAYRIGAECGAFTPNEKAARAFVRAFNKARDKNVTS